MMLGKIKYGKIAVVISLTVLIWVWADLALHEEHPVSNVPLTIARSTNRAIWVNFVDENESLVPVYNLKTIVLKGPASKISEVRRNLKTGSLQLEFFLDAEQARKVGLDEYPLDVLDLLRKSDQVKELGLSVQSCDPNNLTVNVVELVKKELDIECFDESGAPLEVASIEPSSKVDMFVPSDSRLTARVQLTAREIEQARLSVVVKTPFVVFAEGQTRQAATEVRIKMPPEADTLSEYLIGEAKLGIALSVNLQGKYNVSVNLNEVVNPFPILATEEAKLAYESQPFQMTLYILDSDATEEEQRREVVYNFPEKFVRSNEIKLNPLQQPAEARFKLIPLSSAPTSSGRPD